MPHPGQHLEAAAGNGIGHGAGFGHREGAVFRAGHHQHRTDDPAHQGVVIGAARHHAVDGPAHRLRIDGGNGGADVGHHVRLGALGGRAGESGHGAVDEQLGDGAQAAQDQGHQAEVQLLPPARRRGGAVHQHGGASALGIERGEDAAHHAAPGVAEQDAVLDLEMIEDLAQALRAFLQGEMPRQRIAAAVTRRVDQDHPVAAAEILGLRLPHRAGHQQAGPAHHGGAAAADVDVDVAEQGFDALSAQRNYGGRDGVWHEGLDWQAWMGPDPSQRLSRAQPRDSG